MKIVSDLMTKNLITLKESDNLYAGRMLFKKHGIRNLPVTDDSTGMYKGLLSQRDILNHAFNVVEKYGFNKLKSREERAQIGEVMDQDWPTVSSTDNLKQVAGQIIEHKHTCLPVVDDGKLVGIVTALDFVKLSQYLLNQ